MPRGGNTTMGWLARASASMALACCLAGCLEMTARVDFKPDGTATSVSEIRVLKVLVDEIRKSQAAERKKPSSTSKTASMDFVALCKSGLKLLNPAAKDGKAKTPTMATTSPDDLVGRISTRGDKLVCTLTQTMPDPMQTYADTATKSGASPAIAKLERLPTGGGYRVTSSIRGSDILGPDTTFTAAERQGLQLLASVLPKEAGITMTISARRIDKTNGQLSADGTAVSWTILFAKLFDSPPEAELFTATADIYF
jgi:hypothetical protein